jgi:hypothetical protein
MKGMMVSNKTRQGSACTSNLKLAGFSLVAEPIDTLVYTDVSTPAKPLHCMLNSGGFFFASGCF